MNIKPYQVLHYHRGIAKIALGDEKKTVFTDLKLKRGDWVLCHDDFILKKIPKKLAELRLWTAKNSSTVMPSAV